jgi:hypothetical protein
MKALKGVVIIMTLTIAVLMTLIAYGMYQKSQDPNFKFFDLGTGNKTAPASQTVINGPMVPISGTQAPTERLAFGDVTLDLPPGSQITSATVSGEKLVVIVREPSAQNQSIWVVDLATGQVLGRVKTQP